MIAYAASQHCLTCEPALAALPLLADLQTRSGTHLAPQLVIQA